MSCRYCGGSLRPLWRRPGECREWDCIGCGLRYQEPLKVPAEPPNSVRKEDQ